MVYLAAAGATHLLDRYEDMSLDSVNILVKVQTSVEAIRALERRQSEQAAFSPRIMQELNARGEDVGAHLDQLASVTPDTKPIAQIASAYSVVSDSLSEQTRLVDEGRLEEAATYYVTRVEPNLDALDAAVLDAEERFGTLARDAHAQSVWGRIGIVALSVLLSWWFVRRTEREARAASTLAAERAALIRSEERFRTLARDVSDVFLISDSDGALHYCSPAVQGAWGYEPGALDGVSILELVHSDDRSAAQDALDQARRRPAAKARSELRVRYADDSWHACEVIASNLLHDPNIRGVVLTFRDVSELRLSEARYRTIVESAQEGIAISDPEGRFTFVNRRMAAMHGYSPDEMIGKFLFSFMTPEAVSIAKTSLARVREFGIDRLEFPLQHRDGHEMWAIISANPLFGADGSHAGTLAMITDITDRKRVEQELASERAALSASEERFRTLARDVSDVFLVTDSDGRIHYHSPAIQTAWGYEINAVEDSVILDLVHPDDRAAAQAMLDQSGSSPQSRVRSELRVRYADDSWHPCEVIASNLLADANIHGIVLTFHDITERKTYEQELTRLAFYDPLSGLPNRALFRERLDNALTRSARWRRTVGVIFMDLDGFKVVNDSLGHDAGDELLRIVGERLTGCLRTGDTVARLGGDEFTIALEDIGGVDDATFVAERILDALRLPVLIAEREVFVSASLGIALSDPAADTAELLMRNADLAMYSAKTSGRSRYEVFDSSMNASVLQRLEMESQLHGAVDRGEFRILYQPILELNSGQMIEVEALLRWDRPGRGLVPPSEFLPICEETGLIVPIGRWMIEQVCIQARRWLDDAPKDPPLVVGVNLSLRQFIEPGLIMDVRRALDASGLPPNCLRFEITEKLLTERSTTVIANLNGLRNLGVQLAIDDFGTGYSSLSYLKRLPIDAIKIDQSFIKGLGEPQSTAIVRSMIDLAKSLDLTVTGEGIETAEQLQQLRDMGCHMGQGFVFARPGSASDVADLLGSTQAGNTSLSA